MSIAFKFGTSLGFYIHDLLYKSHQFNCQFMIQSQQLLTAVDTIDMGNLCRFLPQWPFARVDMDNPYDFVLGDGY